MSPASRTAVLAAVLTVCTIGCDKNAQVLTDTSAAGSAGGATAGDAQLDAASERIEQALRADSSLRSFELEADDENGRVVLEGTVRSEQQKALAMQIAQRGAGGLQVENRIRVQAR